MKRLLALGAAVLVLVAAAAWSVSQPPASSAPSSALRIDVEEKNPWTNLKLNNDPREFRFAIVSDRTGGHRPQIFSKAVERLNLLQPEFVVTVGDLIEGYTEEKEKMESQWKEFHDYVKKLQMPFFYVPGNHDIANPLMEKEWIRTLGRRYYHFVYRGVLFLMLDSEDPPERGTKAKEADRNAIRISEEQVAYVRKTLEANRDVRWTIVSLHRPLWYMQEFDKSRFGEVEKLLAGRNYTVFAGHIHRYQKFVRQGMNYYQLATTGGGSKLRGVNYGEFDHLTWVTMKKDGPIIANVMLDGVLDESLKVADTAEEGVPTKDRKPVQPATVKVIYKGKPVAGAWIAFHTYNKTTKKYTRVSEGTADEDGTAAMSTYKAFDGVPEGEYTVTVVWQVPRFDITGKPTENRLPPQYATTAGSPLKAVVQKAEKSTFTLDLD